jgi:spoIIIJ-associated protein
MSENQGFKGKRTFTGNAPRPPATPLDRERVTRELKTFLDAVVRELNLSIEYKVTLSTPVSGGAASEPGNGPRSEVAADEPEVSVAFSGADEAILLERSAELLLAIEHIAHRWLRLDPRMHDHVRFDCGNYRAAHLEELKLSARVAAQRVRETGQPFQFNPMSSRERRLIHLELSNAAGVRTMSEGTGDRRQLVIYPATKK